ncbi:hypothetical protein LTR56_008798 [Elasticomyces elasticus]|nr:hypothetical protein LTR22_021699 [Elasticomyces elasticus]KAK3645920.1 hypothetical protein LTR56_008798 [Elasticomyces elasticus]KAK4928129.1 hypothetical protein LTR49_005067 [Elasticomyces elasticus]KAK5765881.1 hypothetical protein LTS12_003888 [Elasticomyces elasticus]
MATVKYRPGPYQGYFGGPYGSLSGYGGYPGDFGYGAMNPWLYSPYPWSPFVNQFAGYGYDDGYDDGYDGYDDGIRMVEMFKNGLCTGVQLQGMMGQTGGWGGSGRGGGWGGGSGWGGRGWGGRGSRSYGGGRNVVLGVFLEGAEGVAVEQS